jgi:hypothetical protein
VQLDWGERRRLGGPAEFVVTKPVPKYTTTLILYFYFFSFYFASFLFSCFCFVSHKQFSVVSLAESSNRLAFCVLSVLVVFCVGCGDSMTHR